MDTIDLIQVFEYFYLELVNPPEPTRPPHLIESCKKVFTPIPHMKKFVPPHPSKKIFNGNI